MSLLSLDARWRRFNDENRECACCGQRFNGVYDIGFDHPDSWPHGALQDTGQPELVVGDDKLSSDLCRWGEHRFIRCVLPLPIRGSDEVFHFGVWGSVKPENFYAYIDHSFGETEAFEGCFSWLMNALHGLHTEGSVPCDLFPGAEGQRPTLMAQDGPVKKAQEAGISFDALLDIYAAYGNDIRPHLMSD